jgi:uncharacterized protein (DUF2235 family)
MAMKRIVACCDGTWNDSDEGTGYTNVSRLAWAVQSTDTRGGKDIAQILFYQSGVGTEGDLASKVGGAALGLGLSHNIRDAYAFVCNNYNAGDEIFLFGFSRGAYTARSLSGLIGYAGLLGKQDLDRFFELWDGYKEPDEKKRKDALDSFGGRHQGVSIKVIGVWDTVGSVGIPADIARLDVLNFRRYYGFHDTSLGLHVEHAFHALALDERRKNFLPTLWTQKPEGKAKGQELKQVWFAGVHCDVGGGYPVHGSSDIPLAWMASEVAPYLGIDFDYLKLRRDLSSKWSLGALHESYKGFWITLPGGQQTRTPFTADQAASCEKIHATVAYRKKNGGLGADGKAYASKVVKDADYQAFNLDLSTLESGLKWADTDVKQAEPASKKAGSFYDKLIKALGGG